MAAAHPLAADLVLLNGRLHTMDARNTVAEALAIRDGKIVAVGTSAEMAPLAGAGTEVIDCAGRPVLPGLVDSHVHVANGVARAHDPVECRDIFEPSLRSVEDLIRRLREHAQATPPGTWLIGRGSPLADTRLREGRLPTRAELDAAAPEHPCWVAFGAHVIVANSAAIRERGITGDTPSPRGGTVVKDLNTGEPTGVFRERAQYLITGLGQDVPPEVIAERILLELEYALSRGVTTIHDIIINDREVRAYQLLAREGRLPLRVQMIMRVIEVKFDKWSLEDLGLVHGFGSEWLQVGGIKMSIDGGFTGKNAAFREPLGIDNEHEHNPGLIRITQDELDETVARYHRAGMRICTHAIGDLALDMILEAYDKAITAYPRPDHRHRVEHMGNWMMTPERIARAKRLGLLPIPNPPFLYYQGDPLIAMLERRVTEQGFPFRTLWDAGFPLTFGTDGGNSYPIDPLGDAGTAVAKATRSGARITPDQALSVAEALRAQTVNAAYTGFRERDLGTLAVGKLADVAVLGDDPFSTPPERFHELPVDLTIAGGRVTYRRAAGAGAPAPRAVTVAGGGRGCACPE